MQTNYFPKIVKNMIVMIIVTICIFLMIGLMTTAKPANRLTSTIFTDWTTHMNHSIFTFLFSLENRAFSMSELQSAKQMNGSDLLFQWSTSIRFHDLKSFIGNELPGFSTYEQNVIIASDPFPDFDLLSHESGPPIEEILEDRVAVPEEEAEEEELERIPIAEKVVFLYHSHNRESFLPHLPEETDPNRAYHETMNITKVSDRLASKLEEYGIGTEVDRTDITTILHEKGWKYGSSYRASRPVVEAAFNDYKHLQYIFDIHRDSLPYKKTTAYIDDVAFATILFVVGAENKNYEKNLKLATKLHYLLEDTYPGLSKGVVTKEGPNSNGVYNQDLSENALLLEIGGYDNHMEELYRSAEAFADVFQSYYFEGFKVQGGN